jgi:hypothetical protein
MSTVLTGKYHEAAEERERLGVVECPNPECEDGVVCVTGTERGPEGEPIPVPEQERCPDCKGTGTTPAAFPTQQEPDMDTLSSDPERPNKSAITPTQQEGSDAPPGCPIHPYGPDAHCPECSTDQQEDTHDE